MQIKTLADILAESDTDSASASCTHPKTQAAPSQRRQKIPNNRRQTSKRPSADIKSNESPLTDMATLQTRKPKKCKQRFHPAADFKPEPSDTPTYQPPKAQTIKEMLAEVKRPIHKDKDSDGVIASAAPFLQASNTDTDIAGLDTGDMTGLDDNIPAALKAYLRTPDQKQADIDAIKAESRLRWLAFYYLSRREYGRAELRQKFIDKEQDPKQIDALLDEFADKGYQSDYRTSLMLIRENIRKGRGRGRIKQAFYHKKVALPTNIDELIDMANTESDEFSEFVEDNDSLVDGVDWLKLAVMARTKKYGDAIPLEPKDKARQLRFLQYRGFKTDVCFAALHHTQDSLHERF